MSGSEDDKGKRFAEIVLPYLDEAFRLARWLTGNRADAEDVLQEASLRAFNGLDQFRGGNARAWFLTIARNTAFNWLKKNRTDCLSLDEMSEQSIEAAGQSTTATPEAIVLGKIDSDRIHQAIANLPLVFREIVIMREIQGLSYREMAQIAGLPIGTVMSRLARARNLLVLALAET